MAKAYLAAFPDRRHADMALDELTASGYDPKEISVIVRDEEGGVTQETGTGRPVAEGAASGATTGGLIGGLAGLLIGIGAITIPGIGAILIGGPLAAALGLTGAAATTVSGAVTGALAGGMVGALVGLGVPEETARVYEDRVRRGGVLLAVPMREDEDRAREILEDHGADQITIITT